MTWLGRAAPLLAAPLLVCVPALAQVPPGSPVPRILPAPPAAVGPAAPPAPLPAAGEVPAVALPVAAVRIEGATAYPEAELAPLVAGLTGPAVPLERIEQARLALLRRYRDDGYVLTGVSAELAQGGLLRFLVAEGRVAEVRLDGEIGPAATQVLMFLEPLVTVGPLNQALLERQLLLAQEVPGVTVRAVLRPIPGGEAGALQLVAQLARTPFTGLAAADNRGFRLVGPEQGVVALSLNSFTQFGERTDLVLFRAGGNTQNFGQVATEAFLGRSGLRGRIYAGRGIARPSDNLRAIGYEGTTTLWGIGLTYPMIRRRQESLNLIAALEALESEIRIGSGTGGDVRSSYDSLRVIRLGAEWARQDLLLGETRPAVNSLSIRLSQGVEGFGASRNDARLPGRLGQEVDFTKVTGEISRNQALFSPWEGATVSLFALAAGQWTNSVLPQPEKFFLGGLRLNRGFYAGEVSGDRALSTVAELRFEESYQIPLFAHTFDVAAQYYLFYDWGQSFEVQNDVPDRVLRSAGLGVRLTVDRQTELQLEGVSRMTRRPQGDTGVTALSSQAVYWRVLTRF